jgi:hypothetical protein
MLVVEIRFFTNDLKNMAVWDSGAAYIPKQPSHGVDTPKSPEMFHGMEEIAVRIKTTLKRQGIDIGRYNSEKAEKKRV